MYKSILGNNAKNIDVCMLAKKDYPQKARHCTDFEADPDDQKPDTFFVA